MSCYTTKLVKFSFPAVRKMKRKPHASLTGSQVFSYSAPKRWRDSLKILLKPFASLHQVSMVKHDSNMVTSSNPGDLWSTAINALLKSYLKRPSLDSALSTWSFTRTASSSTYGCPWAHCVVVCKGLLE